MSDLVYLYGFVPADSTPPSNLDGIAGRSVALIDIGFVRAAVSHVPADVYAADRIEPQLQDLSWVAQQGVAHETVVAWFVDHSEILPASLFTLYSGDDALRNAASARAPQLASELARLRYKREWDLKISVDEKELEQHAAALSPRIAELEREAAEAAPGKRYLLERKRNDLLKSETRNAAHALASDVFAAMKAIAIEHRILPLPRGAGDDLPVILHGALLVERSRETDLIAELDSAKRSLGSKGLTLSFSGPWAPYRFTGEHERAADRD